MYSKMLRNERPAQCGEEPSGVMYEPSFAAALSFLQSMRTREKLQDQVSNSLFSCNCEHDITFKGTRKTGA